MFTKTADNKDSLRQSVVHLKEDAKEVAHEAGHKVRELYDAAAHEARDVSATAEKQIRQHPIAATAGALGIGVLLGMLFRRR